MLYPESLCSEMTLCFNAIILTIIIYMTFYSVGHRPRNRSVVNCTGVHEVQGLILSDLILYNVFDTSVLYIILVKENTYSW